jgi:hypothetical protein
LGLKINLHKSEIFYFGKAKDEEDQYKQILGCESGSLPVRYLGIPIHHRKLRNSEWNLVETRFFSKIGCWQSNLLSYGDHLGIYQIFWDVIKFYQKIWDVIKFWFLTG